MCEWLVAVAMDMVTQIVDERSADLRVGVLDPGRMENSMEF